MVKKNESIQISFLEITDINKRKLLIEQCYKEGEGCCFAVWDGIEVKYEQNIIIDNLTFTPILGEEVQKKAVLLPEKAEEYETDEQLDNEILDFIGKWLDIPDDIKQFALWNIKRSWVYEKFNTLNYLRALGDTGVGKTRFLDVLGHIHYKPIETTGATTAAPIFRMIDKWRGSLIMDEADFAKSDETQDIIKIINVGYERGKFIMRCDQNDAKEVNFFDPYCPKILATRKSFYDKAVESRCITQVMVETKRKNIPYSLNDEFFDTTQKLRNKLLMWRFRHYWNIESDKKIELEMELEPRVKQIVNTFISLFSNEGVQLEKFKIFIENYQNELIEERQNSWLGEVVESIHSLLEKGIINITAKDIIEEGQINSSPRAISSALKSLGFGKTKMKRIGGGIKRIISLEPIFLSNIFKRYGNDVTIVTVLWGTGNNNNMSKVSDAPLSISIVTTANTVTHPNPKTEQTFKSATGVYQKIDTTYLPCQRCGELGVNGLRYQDVVNKELVCNACAYLFE